MTVRLTRDSAGGFRLEGVEKAPIEASREGDGFAVAAERPGRLAWSDGERGWIFRSGDEEIARTTRALPGDAIAPSSLLLADGRLFRIAVAGASTPRVEIGRWDLPGAYVVGSPSRDGWELTRTAAGAALDAGAEMWILTAAEIGRLDGWW